MTPLQGVASRALAPLVVQLSVSGSMRFIADDHEYNAVMVKLEREQAASLRGASRELRAQAAGFVATARHLRRRCDRLSQRTGEVLRKCLVRGA